MTRFTLWITALAVLGYAAWVYYDCSHDPACRVVYCGAKPCGLSHKHP
jgi:hypothetical protein